MIKLDILKNVKNVKINGKEIEIPKLGLSHKLKFDQNKNYEENLKILLKGINSTLTAAEKDLVILHLLEFNGKINSSVIINDEEFKLDDVYISQQLKFEINNKIFKFKSPNSTTEGTVDEVLYKCCVSVKEDGKELEIPNFLDMPPFVLNWFDKITTTLTLIGNKGTIIKGLDKINEVLMWKI